MRKDKESLQMKVTLNLQVKNSKILFQKTKKKKPPLRKTAQHHQNLLLLDRSGSESKQHQNL